MDLHERFETLDVRTIEGFIAEQREEDLHLDFKTSNPGLGTRGDRRNLAIAVSGFANSEGGLLVWGVDARPNSEGVDGASGANEIVSLGLFLSKLNQYSGDAASPIVNGIQHKKIVVSGDRGYAVTFVPESDSGPHMAKLGEDRYYKRSGSQFLRMEHFEVADMFGRLDVRCSV
jgi:predicted HTH transcriptional regulator